MSTHSPDSMRLLERLRRHAAETPGKIVYRDACRGTTLTYHQLMRRTSAFARRLRLQMPGESVVLVCCPNSFEYVVAFLGTLAAGCAVFPITPESPALEIQDVAERANAAAVVGSAEVLAASGGRLGILVDELSEEIDESFAVTAAGGERARVLLLSSGSTGKPKIVCRSGNAVDAVAEQIAVAIGLEPSDGILALVPLCHAYGIEHELLGPIWAGASAHLCRGLDLSLVHRELSGSNITMFPGVPSMFEMLAELGQSDLKLPTLRAAYSAGGPLPVSVSYAFTARFGVRVGQLYGATEFGSITYGNPRDAHFDAGSVGRAMDDVKIRIEDGQIWVAAKSMFSGYLGEASSPLVDGFFPTGDLGKLDDSGNLTITGRIKLMIDIGGQKVNPLEVEEVLSQHPSVAECVVVTVRQSETLVRLKAVIVAKDVTVNVDGLRRFAQQRLAAYKVPRVFEVRESLPHSSTGKVLRHLVQA